MPISTSTPVTHRAPVYFISHGGPPSMFDDKSKPYKAWEETGKRIREDMKELGVKGLVCVSAHWEGEDYGKGVTINTDSSNPLIYDFYNFPAHYYKQTFTSNFSQSTLAAVQATLSKNYSGEISTAKRGLDHGLWVPFKIAFQAEGETPEIIQVSMAGSKVQDQVELGRALGKLRDQGYAIVATGQAVHNLRAYMMSRQTGKLQNQPAFTQFLKSLMSASTSPLTTVTDNVVNLMKDPAYKSAQPTDEHFYPLVVAASAASVESEKFEGVKEGRGEKVFEFDEGALGWAIVRWG